MPTTTPQRSWPYPLPEDLIAQGATVIGQLANAIEHTFAIANNLYSSSEPWTTFPVGMSQMAISDSANNLQWPYTAGQVVTFKPAQTHCWQLFFWQNATHPIISARLGWSSGNPVWMPWETVASNGMPTAMAAGAVSVTPPANGVASAVVTLPSGRFQSESAGGTIHGQVSVVGSADPHSNLASVYALTAQTITIYVWSDANVARSVHWQAEQGLEPPQ